MQERQAEALRTAAAEFLSREANRNNLITVTRAEMSGDGKRATIFITVFPESGETENVAIFGSSQGEQRGRFLLKAAAENHPVPVAVADHRQHGGLFVGDVAEANAPGDHEGQGQFFQLAVFKLSKGAFHLAGQAAKPATQVLQGNLAALDIFLSLFGRERFDQGDVFFGNGQGQLADGDGADHGPGLDWQGFCLRGFGRAGNLGRRGSLGLGLGRLWYGIVQGNRLFPGVYQIGR